MKPAFLELLNNPGCGGQNIQQRRTVSQSKAVRCESTALHGVCQARTTISSSLYAYPPLCVPKPNKRLWRTPEGQSGCGFWLLDGWHPSRITLRQIFSPV